MPWNPKTDWAVNDVPEPTDFNRIEGNTVYLREENKTINGTTFFTDYIKIDDTATIQSWSQSATIARFGHKSWDTATQFGFLQDAGGYVTIAGTAVEIRGNTLLSTGLQVGSTGDLVTLIEWVS